MIFTALVLTMTMPSFGEAPIAIAPVQENTKKKKTNKKQTSARRFNSCKAARKAGFTHMRRGQTGYSSNLDRDGDGVACDKVK